MKQLNPLTLAVMAILAERPMHPYEVSYHMRQRHLDEHIKLKFGSLYHSFERLLESGLVATLETGREGRRPERTVYQLTEAGRQRFDDELRDMLATPRAAYSDFEAGVAFIHHLAKEEAANLLRQRSTNLRKELLQGHAIFEALLARGLSRLVLVEQELAQAMRRAQADWCDQIAAEIESGKLAWYAGLMPGHQDHEESEAVPAGSGTEVGVKE